MTFRRPCCCNLIRLTGDLFIIASCLVQTKYSVLTGLMRRLISIADGRLGKGSAILVSSDEQQVKEWAEQTYGSRIRMLDVHPIHVNHPSWTGTSGSVHKSYFENWLEIAVMAHARAVVGTLSGFSNTAVHMCSTPPAAIDLYTYSVAEKSCRL